MKENLTTLTADGCRSIIRSFKGSFFTVCFIKANGEQTVRCCKAKLASLCSGEWGGNEGDPTVAFVDVNKLKVDPKKAWRRFNPSRLVYIKCGRRIYNGNASH